MQRKTDFLKSFQAPARFFGIPTDFATKQPMTEATGIAMYFTSSLTVVTAPTNEAPRMILSKQFGRSN